MITNRFLNTGVLSTAKRGHFKISQLRLRVLSYLSFHLLPFLSWAILLGTLYPRILWDEYHYLIMNDGDTPLFISFARNILNCPLNVSGGLFINAISSNCLPIVEGSQFTYYTDHPPASGWIMALFYALGADSISEQRMVSVMATLVSSVVFWDLVAEYFDRKTANIAFIFVVSTPLFLFHSVVVHIHIWSLLFSLLTLKYFMSYLKHKTPTSRNLFLCIYFLSLLIDWPNYILGLLILFILVVKKEKLSATLVAILSSIFYFCVRYWSYNFSGEGSNPAISAALETANVLTSPPTMSHIMLILFYFVKSHFLVAIGLPICFFLVFSRGYLGTEQSILLVLFLFQGILHILLFTEWASSHIYWTLFLVFPTSLGLSLGLIQASQAFARKKFAVITAIVIAGLSLSYSYLWWVRDYISSPKPFQTYFAENELANLFSSDETLIWTDTDQVLSGAGFKLRLWVQQPIKQYQPGVNTGLLITKKELSLKVDDSKIPYLDWFDWYLYRLEED